MKSPLSTQSLLTAIVASAFVATSAAHASTEVFIYYTAPETTLSYIGGNVSGISYRTGAAPITLNSLGFIDLPDDLDPNSNYNYYYGNDDGLVGSYKLGIWLNPTISQPTATLLATTTVSAGLSSTYIQGFRYAPIPETTIPADTHFTIAALLPTGPISDPYLLNTYSLNALNIIGPGFGKIAPDATTLTYPSANYPGLLASLGIVNASTAIVPGNLEAIPEPTTATLLALGCTALLIRRRRAPKNTR